MKLPRLLHALSAAAILFSSLPAALAQAGPIARKIARDLAEKLGERGGRDLAEIGGEAGVREIVEKAAAEGGEKLALEVAGYAEQYGAQSLRAFREAPAVMAQTMKKVPAEFAEGAMRAAAREPELVARLATEIGEDALIVAGKHPGVGVDIASKLGRDGCALAKKLSTPDTIRLARFGDDLARLPAAERTSLLTRIGKAPAKVLGYLEKHPKILLTATATATAIVAIDRLLGDGAAPGFIERIAEQFRTPVGIILSSVAALVLARALWWWSRARRLRAGGGK